jgi:hypothetical protein
VSGIEDTAAFVVERLSLIKQLEQRGGQWLRAARTWVQWSIPRGDSLTWNSNDTITITMKQLEELAVEVAASAVAEDRLSR